MGLIKQAKQNMVAAEAKRAIEEGRKVFVAKLNPTLTSGSISGSLGGVAEMIEAIEDVGWRLQALSSHAEGHRPDLVCLFRRSEEPG